MSAGASQGIERATRWALAIGYLVVAVMWAVAVPLLEKPDEVHHAAYVRFVERESRLPVQAGETDAFVEPEAQQPPAYYVAAAQLLRMMHATGLPAWDPEDWVPRINPAFAGDPASLTTNTFWLHGVADGLPEPQPSLDLLVLRLVNVLLGLATVVLTYRIGLLVFAQRHWPALAAAALVAFLPQLTFVTSSVSNDPLSWAVSAAYLLLLLRLIDAPRDGLYARMALLGVVLGVALVTKSTLFFLVPLVFAARPRAATRSDWLGGLAVWLAAAVAIGAWWFARNAALYGDPLGRQELINPDLYRWNLLPKSARGAYLRGPFWSRTFESFVGYFGFMHIPLPMSAYVGAAAVGAAAAVGLAVHGARVVAGQRSEARDGETHDREARDGETHGRQASDRQVRDRHLRQLVILAVMPMLALAQLVNYNTMVGQPQGRYLFVAAPSIAVLLVLGLEEVTARLSHRLGAGGQGDVPLGAGSPAAGLAVSERTDAGLTAAGGAVSAQPAGGGADTRSRALASLLIAALLALNLFALLGVVVPSYGPFAWSVLLGG
ncbi:MAG: DUF2142 domain-containing protein [Anaerolineae bacterium]